MGPEALEPQRRLGRHSGHDLSEVLGSGTHPVHPGVDLEVDGDSNPATRGPTRGGERLDPLGRVHGRRQPVLEHGGGRVGGTLTQQQDRGGDAVLAQLHPLVDEGHGEAAGAPGQRGPGHRGSAVAVSMGLDHRAELGGHAETGQNGGVVRHCGQVDLGPRRAGASLGHRHHVTGNPGLPSHGHRFGHAADTPFAPFALCAPYSPCAPCAPESTLPTSSGRSPATRPSAGARPAARPCT